MEYGLLLFFGIIAAWMKLTAPRTREALFGYVIALAALSFLLSLLAGQAPNSHYSPY